MLEKYNAEELSIFIAKMNSSSSSHIGFCGENEEEIFSSLQEDFSDNCIAVRYKSDRIIGFLGFDEYDGTAEIWGPFVDEAYIYQEIARDMWEELRKPEIHTYQFFINKENRAAIEFAQKIGASWKGDSLILEAKLNTFLQSSSNGIEEYQEQVKEAFENLHDTEFPRTYYPAVTILEKLDDMHKLFILTDGPKLMGYVYVEADPLHGEGHVEYIAVHPEYRKKGIGRQLLEHALYFLYQTGQHTVRLSVGAEESAAIHLYKSVGFQVVHQVSAFFRREDFELDKALSLRADGDLAGSNKLLVQLAVKEPTNASIHYQCAWSFDVLGEEASAAPYYERAIELGLPRNELEGALIGLGSTYRTLGRYEESQQVLTRGIHEFPDNKAIPIFLAMTYYNLEKADLAMEILLNTIASTSNNEEIKKYHKAILFYADKLDTVWR